MLNQKIIRRLRLALSTLQQEYFARVFIGCENEVDVRNELGCIDFFESHLLKSLRLRNPQPQPGDHGG
ncbi:hypothetical protein ACO0LB_20040 [Undibacterium sp. SXout7W]|uniref:hypothetical protein n=1 Tax=Undibacterium sp. SXout7W TaxID=3413049 RepID=UPI003BF3FAF3